MDIKHINYIICKAFNIADLDDEVNYKIQEGWLPLENGYQFNIDPETNKKIYYLTMIKEYITDYTLIISSVKTFSADSSDELEKKVNEHITNTDARCMGSAYIANGKWIQPIMNMKKDKNTIERKIKY